ncbi:MAG: hypothetical protein PT934_03865 [Peptoniphilaceae bacterium]|uniref:hypothetical protein n=1 Tax=Parvimonas sp. TaxID=1944660 RepID=UPI0025F7DD94|nr:hypothetical protein [Parvimonas sp.]MCI5997132.1 hypothetical protein [Parvimonas sp.]MDD7764886.1 hypothetical protein [Peptoniphilaceae bacterium]
MKHKRKLSLLLVLTLGISPFFGNPNKQDKIYAQEDWIGDVPYYLQVEIEKLYDKLTPQQVEYLRKVGFSNIKMTIRALNLIATAYHSNGYVTGAIDILIDKLFSYVE